MTTAVSPTSAPSPWRAESHPAWAHLSTRLTGWTDVLTTRGDVLVTIYPAPHQSGQPAGMFNHRTALITVDATQALPGQPDPQRIDLHDSRDRARFPVLAGVIAHEVGHAAHTSRRKDADPRIAEWAGLLEEPRMEGQVVRGNPTARDWLRAVADHILGNADPVDAASAARTLILIGGRILAGVLDADDLPDMDAVVGPWLSRRQVAVVGAAVARVVDAADGDTATVLSEARRIAAEFADTDGTDGADGGAQPESGGGCTIPGQSDDSPAAGDGAVAQAVRAIAADAARQMQAAAGVLDPSPQAQADAQGRNQRAIVATQSYRAMRATVHETESRRPSHTEQQHARALTRQLAAASARGITVSRTPAVCPPGRLRTSQLVKRAGQIHAGVTPTAAPWEAQRRRTVDNPPLNVGVALDISGSMEPYAEPTAVAGWMLARAVRELGGSAATATWNHEAAMLPVSARSTAVTVPTICGGSTGLPDALRGLDRHMGFDRVAGARLIAVVTDGDLPNSEAVYQEIAHLTDAGVQVLWLTPPDTHAFAMTPPAGVIAHELDDPNRIGRIIGECAVRALRMA